MISFFASSTLRPRAAYSIQWTKDPKDNMISDLKENFLLMMLVILELISLFFIND